MIKFENINIKYVNDFFCLFNFNCELTSNTLIIGDEFLGSHAILRMLAKIDTHYSGNIFIADKNLKNIKDKDLNIAYIPNKPELFLNKNLYNNLIFPLKIRKFNKKEVKNLINDVIFKYNLENYTKKVKHYSYSEMKIFSLLRAVIRKPKYILLEDFFENLDASLHSLANKIIEDIKPYSIIIASEKDKKHLDYYKDFNILELEKTAD